MECQQCRKETVTSFVYYPLVVCGECYTKLIMGAIKPKPMSFKDEYVMEPLEENSKTGG